MMRNKRISFSFWFRMFVLLLLCVASFGYAMFQGGFVSWFLFYAFLPFVVYALLLACIPLRLTVERNLSQERFSAGNSLSSDIIIKRDIPFPLFYVVVEDEAPETFHLKERVEMKQLIFPWFRKTWRFAYELKDVARGEHHLTAVRVKTGDFFGFIEKEVVIPLERKILVYPRIMDISLQTKKSVNENGTRAIHSFLNEPTNVSAGVREYQQGDRFAWVDWKTTARRGQLMTKEFEQNQTQDLIVFLDHHNPVTFELVISLTASVLQAAMKRGIPVGLIPLGDHSHAFKVGEGESHLHEILYYLARMSLKQAAHPSVELMAKSEYMHTSKYVVTGHLHEGLVSSLQKTGNRKNISVLVAKPNVDHLTTKEKQLVDRLKSLGIWVTVIFEDRLHDVTVR
ncbi:DUF58 domain-containing protein [Bacillus sp. NPDC077027]|uniref:DUF58 domain-containing protein n=1 Tax=Bacillus sp. NPDC077027 TaxID=3390548 RepID=UPI003CFE681E